MVVLAMLYTRTFYGLTHLFRKLPHAAALQSPPSARSSPARWAWRCTSPSAAKSRCWRCCRSATASCRSALTAPPAAEGSLFFALVLLLVSLGKILTTGLTIGSGGSGGVFGPSMVIGGCGGGALGIVLHHFWPSLVPHPATFVIVGMAGFFAAAAKTPFSTLVIVSEMTGNYNLLLPTLWVCAISFLLSDEQSIYSSQVESRSRSPAHQGDYVREVLAGMRVAAFLTTPQQVPVILAGDRLDKIVENLTGTAYQALPVVDAAGRLLGVVTLEEAMIATQSPHLRSLVVAADLMRGGVTPLRPDDPLDRALELFVESDLLALPVVDGEPQRVVAVVKRSDVSSTYLRYVHGSVGRNVPAEQVGSS